MSHPTTHASTVPLPAARGGLTFVEITLALAILMVGLVPLVGIFSTNAAISAKQGAYLAGMNILDATLNHVTSQGYGRLKKASLTPTLRGTLLNNCLIQTNFGQKSYESVTAEDMGNQGFRVRGELPAGVIQYNLELEVTVLFWGRSDFKTDASKIPFKFHFSVYTKTQASQPSYWDVDPDFPGKTVPVVYVRKAESDQPNNPFEVPYYSPERIYQLVGKLTWTEKPNNVRKQITLVTYKTDLIQ